MSVGSIKRSSKTAESVLFSFTAASINGYRRVASSLDRNVSGARSSSGLMLSIPCLFSVGIAKGKRCVDVVLILAASGYQGTNGGMT
jgi:hypothetical protein